MAKELFSSVTKGKIVAFVGSGLSYGIYDNWRETVKKLCQRMRVNLEDVNNIPQERLPEKVEECKRRDPINYHKILKEIFSPKTQIRKIYFYLAELPFEAYLTFNFDNSLAEAVKLKNRSANVFSYPDLPILKLKRKNVFYLHGTLESFGHNEIVFSSSEFEKAYDFERSLLPSFLQHLVMYKQILFLGIGLKEIPIKKLFGAIQSIKNEVIEKTRRVASTFKVPLSFILLPESRDNENESSNDRAYYESMGLTVIEFKPKENYSGLDYIFKEWTSLRIEPISGFQSEEAVELGGINE